MKSYNKLAYPYVVWIAIMIVIPMLLIVLYAFTDSGNEVLTFNFTLENFVRFFQDSTFISVLWTSLKIAVITTIICLLLGYPAAYFISQLNANASTVAILLVTLPMLVNMLVRTYAWMGILSDNGVINNLLSYLGFEKIQLIYTDFAVILGMVYNFIPFMILQIHSALAKMDHSLIEASEDLGANKVQTFLRVTLPLSLPGVISGITLVFLPAVSCFFIPKLLGGGDQLLIGNLIENYFVTTGDWNFGSAISLIMAVVILISMYLTKKLDKEGDER